MIMSLFILILSGFVIVSFVVGVALLFGGYSALPDNSKIAPLDEFQKIQADLKQVSAQREELRQQANTLAVQLEQMKGKLSWAEENVKVLEQMTADASKTQEQLGQVEKDLSFLSQKADAQAVEAIEVITRLESERESLQNTLSQKEKEVLPKMEDFNSLADENQKLKIQIDGYTSKLKDFEPMSASLEETRQHLSQAQEELAKVRLQNEEQMAQANAALVKFNTQIEDLNKEALEKDERIKKFAEELFAVRQEAFGQSQSVLENQNLQKQLEDLRAAHRRLQEKERILIGKLAHSRAVALKFEKMSEELNYPVGS